jgi:hypothetical protein
VKGEMEASSEIDLSKKLGEKGLYLTGINKISQKSQVSIVDRDNPSNKCNLGSETTKKEKVFLGEARTGLLSCYDFFVKKIKQDKGGCLGLILIFVIIGVAIIFFNPTPASDNHHSPQKYSVEPNHSSQSSVESNYAGPLSMDDGWKHSKEEFQTIIDNLRYYTDAPEKQVAALIYTAFNKLKGEISGISIYDVATGIKNVTEQFRNNDIKKGLGGKQSLQKMTAFYMTMKEIAFKQGISEEQSFTITLVGFAAYAPSE